MEKATRYNFEDLYAQVKKGTATREERLELFQWFELYGEDYWNGECYDLGKLTGRPSGIEGLWPIYKAISDETGEPVEWNVVDCEIR